MAQHALGGEEKRAVLREGTVHGLRHARADATTFGMQEQLDVWMLLEQSDHLLGLNGFVHVAISGVSDYVGAACLARYHRCQKLIGQKKNLAVRWNSVYNLRRVRRRAAIVAFSLHRRRRVDV